MPELNDASIPEALSGQISDNDLVLIYDQEAASNKSRKAQRGAFLHDVVRVGGDASLDDVTAATVSAPVGAIDTLTVTLGLIMGATLSKILTVSGSMSVPTIGASAEGSATITLTNAVVGDQVVMALPGTFPAGLLLARAVVSGANTVTAYFYNASAGSISGASYTVRASALRFA
jgi:hypothetical protein